MEIVRLISEGTSASVTAHSTYLSGGSVVFDIMPGIAVVADAAAVDGQDIPAHDPVPTDIAAPGLVQI